MAPKTSFVLACVFLLQVLVQGFCSNVRRSVEDIVPSDRVGPGGVPLQLEVAAKRYCYSLVYEFKKETRPAKFHLQLTFSQPICIDPPSGVGTWTIEETSSEGGWVSTPEYGFFLAQWDNATDTPFVTVEAEHYTRILNPSTRKWLSTSSYANASGTSMVLMPNTGNVRSSPPTNGPALIFHIAFSRAATYRVWVRGRPCSHCLDGLDCSSCTSDSDDDSVHIVAQGSCLTCDSNSRGLTDFDQDGFYWSNTKRNTFQSRSVSFTLSSSPWPPAIRTVGIYQREDGVVVDRMYITGSNDPLESLTDKGPEESPYYDCANKILYFPPKDFVGVDTVQINIDSTKRQVEAVNITMYVGIPIPDDPEDSTTSTGSTTGEQGGEVDGTTGIMSVVDSTPSGDAMLESEEWIMIVGIVAGAVVLVLIIAIIAYCLVSRRREQESEEIDLKELRTASQHLEDLLLDPSMKMLRVLISCIKITTAPTVFKSLLYFYGFHGKHMSLIKTLIEEEVKNADSVTTMFRGTSVASKVLFEYCQLCGKSLLQAALRKSIQNLVQSPHKHEVDPVKVPPGENLEENIQNLRETAKAFVSEIVASADKTPPEFKIICKMIATEAVKKFPNQSQYPCVGGFIFLRFFCPAITACDSANFAIMTEEIPEQARRALVLVTKILQNLSNGIQFGKKETYMIEMNPVITESLPIIHKYFDTLMEPVTYNEEEPLDITPKKSQNSFNELTKFLRSCVAQLKEKYEKESWWQEFEQLLKDSETNKVNQWKCIHHKMCLYDIIPEVSKYDRQLFCRLLIV